MGSYMSSREIKITVRLNKLEKERYDELARQKQKHLAELIRYMLEKECEIKGI